MSRKNNPRYTEMMREEKRDTWAALQAGRGLLTLQTALIISSRERRCRASESADEAEELAAGIARLATERMERR